jgi:transposase InsO family protein
MIASASRGKASKGYAARSDHRSRGLLTGPDAKVKLERNIKYLRRSGISKFKYGEGETVTWAMV